MQSCKAHERRNFYDHEVFCLATNLGRGFSGFNRTPQKL